MYVDALKSFPKAEIKLKTEKGTAHHIKTDVFKNQMWYVYEGGVGGGLVALTHERVKEVIELNRNGKFPADLNDFIDTEIEIAEPDYSNVVGQDSLSRFEHSFKKKKKKKPRNKPKGEAGNNDGITQKPVHKPEGNKPAQNNNTQANNGKKPFKKRKNNNKPRNPKTENNEKV
jgi:hypothetical protein